MNFGEYIERVRTWRMSFGGTEASGSADYIGGAVNSAYREMLSHFDVPVRVNEAIIELRPEFTDGYLLATQGLNIATLHDTSTYTGFTYQHWGGKLHVGDTGMYYTVVRTDLGDTSPHYVHLDRPYQSTSTASAAYSLYTDLYPLPGDCRRVENARLGGSSGYKLYSRSFSDFDAKHTHALRSTPSGNPTEYAVWQQRRSAWFSETCSVTNGSAFVDFVQDSYYLGVENWANRVLLTAEGDRYRVVRQNNTALTHTVQVELDRVYGGTTVTNTLVSVDPKGTQLIQFYPPPTDSNSVVVKYQGSDHNMINESDEPIIAPDYHEALLDGAIFRMAQFDRLDPERLVYLERTWLRSLNRFLNQRSFNRSNVFQRRLWGGRVIGRAINIPEFVDDD